MDHVDLGYVDADADTDVVTGPEVQKDGREDTEGIRRMEERTVKE